MAFGVVSPSVKLTFVINSAWLDLPHRDHSEMTPIFLIYSGSQISGFGVVGHPSLYFVFVVAFYDVAISDQIILGRSVTIGVMTIC